MEPIARKQRTEDEDTHCRLRHGLNTDCLARIFQYLDSVDLYTVGEMNVVFNEIIKDFVIPKHTVDFEQIFNEDIAEQFFQRYGTKIQKFLFANPPVTQKHLQLNQFNQFNELNQLIAEHCSIDQLRDVSIYLFGKNQPGHFDLENSDIAELEGDIHARDEKEIINFPSHYSRVEKFIFLWMGLKSMRITLSLTERLLSLSLSNVRLDPNFDWTKFMNLTKLELRDVRGINADKFIEILRRRPNLERFGHCESFEDSTDDALGTYCDDKIRIFHIEDIDPENRNFYHFIPKFKNQRTHYCC